MQGNQARINQEVAIALERLNGRMETFETWRNERDEERRRIEERRDDRDDKRPDDKRANMALVVAAIGVMIAACGSGFSLVSYVAQHWH